MNFDVTKNQCIFIVSAKKSLANPGVFLPSAPKIQEYFEPSLPLRACMHVWYGKYMGYIHVCASEGPEWLRNGWYGNDLFD
jgi:hypothetical protein